MCCNGTLFNYVTLVDDDLPKLEKHTQLRLKNRKGQATFDEPCVLHTGSGCGAYEDRPDTCKRYICHLLIVVKREEMTEDEALLIIKEGRALVDNVKEYVAFEAGMPLAVSSWEGPPEGISEEARLAWERTAYHLGKHFLASVNEEVDVAEDTAPASGSPSFAEEVDVLRPRVQRASLFTAAARRRRGAAPRSYDAPKKLAGKTLSVP